MKVLFEDPRESGNPDVSRELAAALQILHINKYGERFTDGLYIVLAEFTSFTKEEIIAQYDEVLSKI